ncbi:MAG: low molecular weight phosphotyrosine protein phosphatase [Schwartzia sp.]|nr:low molecular weight phosphotyrosine protein phosphatase [Schwartzia sp. (in: firmicutes)]
MTRILFICHGNICRSPMAEFVMKELVQRAGCAERFLIASAATTTEELGRDTHPGTREELRRQGIPFTRRQARQLRWGEYGDWDYLVAMDRENLADIPSLLGADRDGKVRRLLSFAGEERDVADPWYTGDFATTYRDVLRGCEALLRMILAKEPPPGKRENAAEDTAAP